MSFRTVTRAAALVAAGTVVSRVFGLLREMATARFFGTTFIYDAFLVAFMIPNFFRGIIAEGALSTAFIPVFTDYLSDPDRAPECPRIANICFTFSLCATAVLFAAALALSFGAPPFLSPAGKWYWTFSLLRWTFPYLVFVSLAALSMGVLHAHKHFLVPSYAPAVLDIVWIAALFTIVPLFGESLERRTIGLCIGAVAGGAAQFLVQVPAAARRGFSFRLDFGFSHPALRRMGVLIAPVLVGVAVGPINLLVDYGLANFLATGAASGLWYATRIYQLPLGVFAVSLSTAVLPWFAEHVSRGRTEELRAQMLSSFALLLFVLLPSAVFLILLRREIVAVLFMRGLFDARSVSLTAAPLAAYAPGLLGYGAAAVLTRGFYAFKDTRTPVLVGVASIAVNAALDAALMAPLGHTGIALATSFVGTLNFLFLLVLFRRMHLRVPLAGLRAPAAKTVLASALMAVFLAGAARLGAAAPLPLCVAAAGAAAVYLGVSHLLKPLGGTWV